VVGWEVGVECYGVEGVRGHYSESAGGDSEHESAANRFRAKSAKTD